MNGKPRTDWWAVIRESSVSSSRQALRCVGKRIPCIFHNPLLGKCSPKDSQTYYS